MNLLHQIYEWSKRSLEILKSRVLSYMTYLYVRRSNDTPYALRHSFVTRLVDNGTSLPKIQALQGDSRVGASLLDAAMKQ